QMRDYLREKGGDADEIALYGQEKMGTTWSICKMNMLLHGISHADIRQGDTLREPEHKDENNELLRFDRVVANPPFSQNYIKKGIVFPGRFPVWLPEKGKKADLMFVQHMLAVLKHNGRLATVMPHGVLFRSGDEREARKYFIDHGYLEAIIGLPSNLFYGTGIPACILVMNKEGADKRKSVLFINADREYSEDKAQNHLRPEDIDKIINAYRKSDNIPGYARVVPTDEIIKEDYNCNIRRYVDNAPPPEPHDVRAHLHGGIPLAEIESLGHFWQNYTGLQADIFVPRDTAYMNFSPTLTAKRDIAEFVNQHTGVLKANQALMTQLEKWWENNLPIVEALAPDAANQHARPRNVYVMRSQLMESINEAFAQQNLLTSFQVRGAFASYVDYLKADFKSIAASGWGAELIPSEDILQSQFPEVLEEQANAQARLAELQALFAAADDEDFEDSDDTGVMSSDQVKELKSKLKDAKGMVKLCKRDPGLGSAEEYQEKVSQIEAQLKRHKVLEDEAKELKKVIKAIENKRDELVLSAREKISQDEARVVIVARLKKLLLNTYNRYLRTEQRACIAVIENLWVKYAITAKEMESQRDKASKQLHDFLMELGYE
ncbi:N-6 DNA methylase, partial [Klebsiella michiganensis]|uniref:N-6 DNA methylase n=3 Tax=Klebsiella/Raoultella group TaxID=2890311 RepID=UPI001B8207E4